MAAAGLVTGSALAVSVPAARPARAAVAAVGAPGTSAAGRSPAISIAPGHGGTPPSATRAPSTPVTASAGTQPAAPSAGGPSATPPRSASPASPREGTQPVRAPAPSGAAASTAPPAPAQYLTVCGTEICLGGTVWHPYGASHSPLQGGADATSTMALAGEERLDMVRLTNFLVESGPLSGAYDPARWNQVDAYLAQASQRGERILLDLSSYRNLLWNNCLGPTYDWGPFLSWLSRRVNSVDGRAYAQDPTLAIIALAGEYHNPGTYTFTANDGQSCTISFTGQQLDTFYSRTLAELRADMPHQLAETGGLSYLDWSSGIDWKTIMADPNDQICSIHVYSSGDAGTTVPNVASYCGSLGKPWMMEEFGFPQSDGDATRAQEFQQRYDLATRYGAAGVAFWNLGPENVATSPTTFDVNATTPLTLAVVRGNATAWGSLPQGVRGPVAQLPGEPTTL